MKNSNARDSNNSIIRLYNLLLIIFFIPITLYTLWQAFRITSWRFFTQRLVLKQTQSDSAPLWIHAASVGEVIAAKPFIQLINKNYPQLPIIITTTTPTGAKIVDSFINTDINESKNTNITHCYFPIDFKISIARFLDGFNPCCCLIMETELWPNLYQSCKTRNIPVLIINGRLSSRTLKTPNWVRKIYRVTLSNVTQILARSNDDYNNFISLGADKNNIKMMGNIKFAVTNDKRAYMPPFESQAYVLAASTHEHEEQRIIKIWQSLGNKSLLLVIAPRHPDRMKKILRQLSDIPAERFAFHSRQDQVNKGTLVYFLDTVGRLAQHLQYAEIVIMGGSMVPVGGHNILEPAQLGKPIIFGPHMENFSDEARLFLDNNAAFQFASDAELKNQLRKLLAEPKYRDLLGQNAYQLMQKNKDIANIYLAEIIKHCKLEKEKGCCKN